MAFADSCHRQRQSICLSITILSAIARHGNGYVRTDLTEGSYRRLKCQDLALIEPA